MKIIASIEVEDSSNELEKVLKANSEKSDNKIKSYTLQKSGNNILINIKSDNSSAFRAVVNSVSKLMSIFEKTKKMIEDGS